MLAGLLTVGHHNVLISTLDMHWESAGIILVQVAEQELHEVQTAHGWLGWVCRELGDHADHDHVEQTFCWDWVRAWAVFSSKC